MTLDLMGGSSYIWRFKHGLFHHSYPNLSGADDDIDIGPLGRLAPGQRRRFFHGLQQYYLWAFYGLLTVKWNFVDDFKNALRGRIGSHTFPRPKGWELVNLLVAKLAFCGWALVLPALFHRWWVVLLFYALTSFVLGVTLAVVFQFAHCVEEADFPEPPAGPQTMGTPWAIHQLRTTVDFARRNPVLTWYLGGLNFQIEHHLFPRICHVHYPAIAPIVQKVCAEFDVRYRANDGFFSAMASHWRWLRAMGRPLTGG
jgi:linoleoyl-CoA desaturase